MSSPFHPQQQPPQGNFYPRPPEVSRGPSCLLIVLMLMGGCALVLAVACCGSVMYFAKAPQASAAAKVPFKLDEVPVPAFPQRGEATEAAPRVLRYDLSLGESGGFYDTPGQGGKLQLYLPAGDHQPKSLPCVLIPGAGSNLLAGMLLGDGDSPEHIP